MKEKLRKIGENVCRMIIAPVSRNATFFVLMYFLGVVCAWLTLPNTRGAKLYDHLYGELFLDLYVLCAILAVIPRRVRQWVRGVLSVLAYVVSFADVYCFDKFGSTLTPSMLMLVGETDAREAGEFVRLFLSPEMLACSAMWVLGIALLHGVIAFFEKCLAPHLSHLATRLSSLAPRLSHLPSYLFSLLILYLLYTAVEECWDNKRSTWRLMTQKSIGAVEHDLTRNDKAVLYTAPYRLAFSIYSNVLAAKQVDQLIAATDKAVVDSCSFRSPHIVFIIGESFGRHHSQQYGYSVPTTPRQIQREKSGQLVKFSDVVAPWNLTSFVFKNLFSMHVIGEKGEWCDYPLFPQLFRKAGYEVTFLTNQFLPKAKQAVYDFSGGFFLNHPQLSASMFDIRNDKTYLFDEGLLSDYDQLCGRRKEGGMKDVPTLTIFHLLGQHTAYNIRCPKSKKKFRMEDYAETRPELNHRQRRFLADYDNACLYNDSIVDQICRRFEQEDAIVIYMPDHGEECYEGNRGILCRRHTQKIDYDLAHFEFEVPFWIWCSQSYIGNHPDIFQQVKAAKDRRLMTDALPHMLLYLAGIAAPTYHSEYNILSPDYNEKRPRILQDGADYDALRGNR
ncbi:MAG: sulfatase-like hydrolase/transferase [Prevotella sp.]|nr:sulfatase-like hydrolase/transferase [Prevotella sp.]